MSTKTFFIDVNLKWGQSLNSFSGRELQRLKIIYQTTDNFLLFDELAIFVQKTSERKIVLEHHLQITGNPLKRFLISGTIGTSEPTKVYLCHVNKETS